MNPGAKLELRQVAACPLIWRLDNEPAVHRSSAFVRAQYVLLCDDAPLEGDEDVAVAVALTGPA